MSGWLLLCISFTTGFMLFQSTSAQDFSSYANVSQFSCDTANQRILLSSSCGGIISPCYWNSRTLKVEAGTKIWEIATAPSSGIPVSGYRITITNFDLTSTVGNLDVGSTILYVSNRNIINRTLTLNGNASVSPGVLLDYVSQPNENRFVGESFDVDGSRIFLSLNTSTNETTYGFNMTYCADFNKCDAAYTPPLCDAATGSCVRNGFDNYTCICDTGFTSDNCSIDIDECTIASTCASNTTCTNARGSYTCTCNTGFSGDGLTNCADINECTDGTNNCHTNATCINTEGSFTCECKPSFTGNGTLCTDVDECGSGADNCHVHANCTNSFGSFLCICNDGYTGNGTACDDIDDCVVYNISCADNAHCVNTPGSHMCACDNGFNGTGSINCSDINECNTGSHTCDVNANCTNTFGSFECTCNANFTGDGFSCTSTGVDHATTTLFLTSTTVINATETPAIMTNTTQSTASMNNATQTTILIANATQPQTATTNITQPPTATANITQTTAARTNTTHMPAARTNATPTISSTNNVTSTASEVNNATPTPPIMTTENLTSVTGTDILSTAMLETMQSSTLFTNSSEATTGTTMEPMAEMCNATTIRSEDLEFSFNSTLPYRIAYSNEMCQSGYPRALIQCGVSNMSNEYEFSLSTLLFVTCTQDSIAESVNVNFSQITSTSLEETLLRLDLSTSMIDEVSSADIEAIVGFFTELANNSELVEITESTFVRALSITDHATQVISTLDANQNLTDVTQNLVQSMITLGYHTNIDNANSSLTSLTPNIAALIVDETNFDASFQFQPDVYVGNSSTLSQPLSINISSEVLLNASGSQATTVARRRRNVQSNQTCLRMVFFLHQTSDLFPSRDKTNWVVSADINNFTVTGITNGVDITYSNINTKGGKNENENPLLATYVNQTCSFWDFSIGDWSTEGCCLVEGSNPPQCRCNHLTNFAMLVSVYDIPNNVALTIITLVGCILSIVGLFFTIVCLLISKEIRSRRPVKVLLNICVNLMLAYIVFVCGIDKRYHVVGCLTGAIFLHFFLLCSCCWMAVYAYLLYKSCVQVLDATWNNYFVKVGLAAYGTPLLIVVVNVIVTLLLSHTPSLPPVCGYDLTQEVAVSAMLADHMCWLRGYSLYFSFLLPVGIIMLFNLVVFFLVLRKLTWKRKEITSAQKRTIKQQLVNALTIAITLGLVWVFAYLMLISTDVNYVNIMNWIFTILASFQGLCMFLLLCVRNSDVRQVWWPPIRKFFMYPCQESSSKVAPSIEDQNSKVPSAPGRPSTAFSELSEH